MWKLRYYWPLIAFVVPSAVIGYGIVLPGSSVAGWNSLTLGFAGTLIGASVSYILGIGSALRSSCPIAVPAWVRINRYLNRQASSPRGLFGRVLGVIWTREHRHINRAALDLLEIRPGERLLEIGCGPGEALREVVRRGGSVVGVDVSATMMLLARKRNRRAVEKKSVELRLASRGKLDLEPAAFDGAYSVHCVYFWASPEQMLADIAGALKPGARLVLAFTPDTPGVPPRFRDSTYRFYTPAKMRELLMKAGFANVRAVPLPASPANIGVIAERP